MAATALWPRSERLGKDFGHIYAGSDNRLKRGRQKTVTWPDDEKICEVRSFLITDAPSTLGVAVHEFLQCQQEDSLLHKKALHLPGLQIMGAKRARMEQDNRLLDVPPGFGHLFAAGVPPQAKPKTDASRAVTLPWHCPQKFLVDASWLWAGGEESSEVASQQERERRILEAFYPRIASIPDSPWEPQEPSKEIDDALVPQIPIVPIEEEMDDMDHQSISPEKGGAVLHKSEHRKIADASTPANGIFLPNAPAKQQHGIAMSFTDANIAAAAAAACMVVKAMGETDLVDKELLVELLKNPKLLNSLTCSKEYMKGKTQNQDCGTASRSAAHQELLIHKMPIDHGAYLDRSPVSILAPWGDCDTMNDTRKMASSAIANTQTQHSTFLSSMNMKPLARKTTPTLNLFSDPELCSGSVQKRVECIQRAHEQIPEIAVTNPLSCSNLKEASFMHACAPREGTRSQNDSSRALQTHSVLAEMPTNSLFSVHTASTPTKDLAQRNSAQVEPPKRMSAELRFVPGRAGARSMPSKTAGRSKRLCSYFNTPRGCRNGESCAFAH